MSGHSDIKYDRKSRMSKHISRSTRSLVVVLVVVVLSFMLVVPYGNMLLDGAASIVVPMKDNVVYVTLRPPNGSVTAAPLDQSVMIRKPLDIKGNASMTGTNNVVVAKRVPAANFTAILILTYMRSGSSLTGEIMQQHPDSFYVFEPLHFIQSVVNSKSPMEFVNGTSIPYGKYNTTEVALHTIRSWFTCDLTNLYKRALMDRQFLGYGQKTAVFTQCVQSLTKVLKEKAQALCALKLRNACLKSKYRVLKIIRVSMRQIQGLMTELPMLKIIHLIRDPRDTMMSQKARAMCGQGSPDDLARCSARYCYRLSDDISLSHSDAVFSNRVMPVLYEDIAYNTEKVCTEMYSFAGIELTDKIKAYVKKLTGNATKEGCKVCQEPWQVGKSHKDAKTHVEKWRTTMTAQFRVIVDILCKDSIKYLNYSVLHPLSVWPEVS